MADPEHSEEASHDWPSLDAQKRHMGVVYGSALEALIHDNQDTSLLRPGESDDDGIDLPLWMRVHYRKNHPDQPHAPAGPVGDYPEALQNVLEWMKTHQNLQPANT